MTSRRSYSGSAVSSVLSGAMGSSDLTCAIADATGWPNTASGECFVTFGRGTAGEERALATRSGTTLTFASIAKRGLEGTTAVAHSAGVAVEHTMSATDADEANAHTSASAGVHGLTGAAVGTTDTQTLTNKTLTAPTIADFTNAQHDHGDTDDGGPVGATSLHGASIFSGFETITAGTDTTIPFTAGGSSENFDTDAFHSTSINQSRITIPSGLDGYYLLTASVNWPSVSSSLLQHWFLLNGSDVGDVSAVRVDTTAYAVRNELTRIRYLTASSHVQLVVRIDGTGGAVNATLSAVRLGL